MNPNPTAHLNDVTAFLAMEVFARAEALEKQGRDIIHLEFGEPDFPTPRVIADTAIEAIQHAQTRYTHTQGIAEFRQAVVEKYQRQYQVKISPDQILTSCGTSILLFMALRMMVPPGHDIILTDPCYACYDSLALLAGINPVRVPVHLKDGFQLDPGAVRRVITPKTRAILINSPMNPTGTVLSKACLAGLAELGLPIIADEIYGDLIYEGEPGTILHHTRHCIVLNGLSKYYAMTGWRLGYMICHPDWIGVAARMHQNMMISAAHFVQKAGVTALRQAEGACADMAREFDQRRRFTLKRLREVGLDPGYYPTGAFYILLRYPDQKRKSLGLAMDILEKAGVAMTPGIDYGPGGEGFIRISYANSLERLDEAIDRLAEYFRHA
jgi:(5-formylfuran-3-yl)methyl phosphate transaminase